MNDGHANIVIRFPGTTELWPLEEPPRRGQRIRNNRGDVCFVTDVLQSGINTYTVTCVGRRDFLDDLRQRSPASLTSELVAVTRKAILSNGNISSGQELYRGFRRNDAWIEKYLGYAAAQRHGQARASAKRPSRTKDDWIQKYLGRAAS